MDPYRCRLCGKSAERDPRFLARKKTGDEFDRFMDLFMSCPDHGHGVIVYDERRSALETKARQRG